MVRNILQLQDGTELATGAQGDAIRGLEFTESTNSETELMPGSVGAGRLEVELYAAHTAIAAGDALLWYTETDGARTLMGRFWAEKPTRATAHTCRVAAYDAAARTEKDLSPWLRSIQDKFPIPLLAFARQVCAQCGVELANDSIPNGDYPVQAFYADDLTARQLLAWVGQACGRFCRATPEGRLEFAWYTPPHWRHSIGAGEDGLMLVRLAGDTLRVQDGTPLDDGPELYRLPCKQTWYYQDTLAFEEYETAPIDKVQIHQSENDVGVVWPADAAGGNALILTGNLLLTADTDEHLRPVAKTLYEQFKDITYTPCRVVVPAGCGLRAGMAAWVTDANGRTFLTYIMQSTVSGGRVALESTGSPSRASSAAVNRQAQKNLRGKVLEMQATVDGLDIKASELSGNYADLRLSVDGLSSTIEKNKTDVGKQLGDVETQLRSEIEQSAEGITSTVSAQKTELQGYADEKAAEALRAAKTEIQQTVDSITLAAESQNDIDLLSGQVWNNSKEAATTLTTARLNDTINVPAELLRDVTGGILKVSFEYKVVAAIKASGQAFGIVVWADYASGNKGEWVKYFDGDLPTASDFTPVTYNFALKDETPAKIYLYATLNGTGSYSIRNAKAVLTGSKVTTLTLKAGETELSSEKITLNGIVTFQSLAAAGETVINGANITTGSLSADRISGGTIRSSTFRSDDTNGTYLTISDAVIRFFDNGKKQVGAIGTLPGAETMAVITNVIGLLPVGGGEAKTLAGFVNANRYIWTDYLNDRKLSWKYDNALGTYVLCGTA